jgi:hypothetical protein
VTYLLIGTQDATNADSALHAHLLVPHGHTPVVEERFWTAAPWPGITFSAEADALGDGVLRIATLSLVRAPTSAPYRPTGPVGFPAGAATAMLSAVQRRELIELGARLAAELDGIAALWEGITGLFVDTAVMGRMDTAVHALPVASLGSSPATG